METTTNATLGPRARNYAEEDVAEDVLTLQPRGAGWCEATDDALARALDLAKGSYQRDFVRGYEALSGSTLKGKARQYSGRYIASQNALLGRLRRAGIVVRERVGAHNKRILVLALAWRGVVAA